MKITIERISTQQIHRPTTSPSPLPPSRRKTRTSGAGVRLKIEPARRISRPATPLLRWKFDKANGKSNPLSDEDKPSGEVGRRSSLKVRPVASARKLGAALWRLHLPEFQNNGGNLQHGVDHFEGSTRCPRVERTRSSSSNSAMEGVTKWDPIGWKESNEPKQIFNEPQQFDQQAMMKISALEAELEHARVKITELEDERRSSKNKLEQFLQKLSEERAAWRSREHGKIRAVIDDIKADMNREKKTRQRLEIVNSKLVNELTDAKLSSKRCRHEYEKERKARELLENACDELAKEIKEGKAKVEALKRESSKVWEEVEEERKMLQMAEVWREERVQMKLVDAKVMLEDKYSQMNRVIEGLECFLNSRSKNSYLVEEKKVESLRQVAASVDMQDVREMTYLPPNPDDMLSVFEDVSFADTKIHTVTPETKLVNKESEERYSNVYIDQSDELEEDASEWETVSHQGSSYSLDGSNKTFRVINASRNGGEETPITEIGEVGPTQTRRFRKVLSISRLWRSYTTNCDSYKMRLSNGRLSNGAIMTPNGYSGEDLGGEWSSPETGNPHLNRGTKGCVEWPRGVQKSSLKSRLLEAKMDSQKIQLRQALKQKI